jgi:hypothetical protein
MFVKLDSSYAPAMTTELKSFSPLSICAFCWMLDETTVQTTSESLKGTQFLALAFSSGNRKRHGLEIVSSYYQVDRSHVGNNYGSLRVNAFYSIK